MRDMFVQEPVPIHQRPRTKIAGTKGLQHVFPMQPVLHHIKSAINRVCNVVGRVLPPADENVLFQHPSSVAKRYHITKLPGDSRQYRSLV